MITLELLNPANALIFKTVRLRALQDRPSAFSATYANEARLSDAEWMKRAEQWCGDKSTTYLAMDADRPCGIAAGFLDGDDAVCAHLASMWVAPSHRRSGIGAMLVNAVLDWARVKRAHTVQLIVTSNNDGAIAFYRRLGFTMTRTVGPYRNDTALNDLEMIRSVS